MSIRQINGVYSQREDRVVLRICSSQDEEYPLVLTRRLTAEVVLVLERLCGKYFSRHQNSLTREATEALADFNKQAIRSQESFSTPYQSGVSFPLGQDPLLITSLSVRCEDQLIRLAVALENHKTLNLSLEPDVVFRFVLLLERLQKQAGWGVDVLDKAALTEAEHDATNLRDAGVTRQKSAH